MLKVANIANTVLLGAIITLATLGAGSTSPAQDYTAIQNRTLQQRYGSRVPRTCADTKAPARGAITAALAARYFICQSEKVSGGSLYLVENVSVQVGGPMPYDRNLRAFDAVDVRAPLYPIRGSFTLYQCADLITAHSGSPSTSCLVYDNPHASGYCHKTTFSDWRCMMGDQSVTSSSRRAPAPK